ncbi:MAG TPA: hypothetical protein VKA46_33640 [Gemmataceae bacterium]|nr:hypothetical protein [Gemmataceae bacterium]
MNEFTPNDLERLARGDSIAPETFRAILASPEAVDQLTKLVQVRELFEEPKDDIDLTNVPAMDVSFEELALYVEGRLKNPARQAAVAQFCQEQLPGFPPPLPRYRRRVAAVREAVGFFGRAAVDFILSGAVKAGRWVARRLPKRAVGFACGMVAGVGLTLWAFIGAESRARDAEAEKAKALVAARHSEAEKVAAETKLDGARTELQNLIVAESTAPITPESFLERSRRVRGYRVQTYEGQPGRLGLSFSPLLGPPYFMGLQIRWTEESEFETVYYAERKALEPVYTHDYGTGDDDKQTITLRFHTTEESARQLGNKQSGNVYFIDEKIPIILSRKGIRIASGHDAEQTFASIVQPKDEQEVREHFLLELTLRRPDQRRPGKSNRVVQVLVRALDGYQKWQEQYFVVPFRQRVDDLPDGPQHYPVWVSLRGILESVPAGEKPPTRFQVLVTELPFDLQAWTVAKSLLNLDDPDIGAAVRARCRVLLKPDKADE